MRNQAAVSTRQRKWYKLRNLRKEDVVGVLAGEFSGGGDRVDEEAD
jgi:hypothetical protein